MDIFLVGGALRDNLLKINSIDKDYVVVGSTPKEMMALGYQKVGGSFPVFLHPKTKEEYALARVERKTKPGYQGFECDFDNTVTLEEDLSRRDLTINAMAQNDKGELIDPYQGRLDLKAGILRHVSLAFLEDPVRLLRAARFAAKFSTLGFIIADETNALMYSMVKNGEVDALIPERLWKETYKALQTSNPSVFFESLRRCGALEKIFPEIHALYGIPATKTFHGEIDTGVHLMMVLDKATELSDSPVVRFASLMHDLGKGVTGFDNLPSHPMHAEKGVALVLALCDRLKVPNEFRDLGVLAAKLHTRAHKSLQASSDELLALLYDLNAFRFEARFKDFLLVCEADALGRIAKKVTPYKQAPFLWAVYQTAKKVSVQNIIKSGAKGAQITVELKAAQALAIEYFIKRG